jgi:hypothetical protein
MLDQRHDRRQIAHAGQIDAYPCPAAGRLRLVGPDLASAWSWLNLFSGSEKYDNDIALWFRNRLWWKDSRRPDLDRRMQNVSKQTPNAERLTKHREGVATRLKRIEVALEDLRDAIESVLAERRRNDLQQDTRR